MFLWVLLLIHFLSFTLFSQGDSQQIDPSPEMQAARIVVLGSSTAAGIGPSHPDSAWVNRYRKFLQTIDPNHQVINLARGGYTTYHLMPNGFSPPGGRPTPDPARNITQALLRNPDAIIINLPSNDAAFGYSVAEQLANYDTILTATNTQNVPVWISTTQPRNLSNTGRQNLMAMRDSTFARFGEKAVDFWNDIANPDGTIKSQYNSGDGIHLNNAGHRILFERVAAKAIPDVVTGIPEALPGAPKGFELHQNFPNPFNATTIIEYALHQAARVELSIFNTRGQRVTTLVDERGLPGKYQITFNADNLAGGFYIYRLQANAEIRAGKMALVK